MQRRKCKMQKCRSKLKKRTFAFSPVILVFSFWFFICFGFWLLTFDFPVQQPVLHGVEGQFGVALQTHFSQDA